MELQGQSILRPATKADVPSMGALQECYSTAAHWTRQQYEELFAEGDGSPERLILIAEQKETTPPDALPAFLGFVVARRLAPEWELENIVVAPGVQRKGVGQMLLKSLLDRAQETNSGAVFLEVRESNAAARSLYLSVGFKEIGRRQAYYTNPTESAILYRWQDPSAEFSE